MRKRTILLSTHINNEVRRIKYLLFFHPDIIFYNTAQYANKILPVPYGLRFGHLPTLKYIHAPYDFLRIYSIDHGWLEGFDRAARTRSSFCGIPFE